MQKEILNGNKKLIPGPISKFAIESSYGNWQPANHLLKIENKVMKMLYGGIKNLVINMPPRHGKSEFLSYYFPIWYLGNYPNRRIIFSTYSQRFANLFGRRCKEFFKNEGIKYFNIELDKSNSSAAEFGIKDNSGSMVSVGAGGSITGRGADLFIIDDPIKNNYDAMSSVIRENQYEWLRSTVMTRMEPRGNILLIMTRWHEEDLAGKLISSHSGEWDKFVMKSIYNENGKEKALWQDRFSLDRLKVIKKEIGNFWFSALYQQEPIPIGGGIFKREKIRYFELQDKLIITQNKSSFNSINDCSIFAAVDLAARNSETSDYTAIAVLAVSKENDIFLLDLIRDRFDPAYHIQLIKNVYHKYKPILIGIEAVQYQASLVSIASKEGLPVKPIAARGDKVMRSFTTAAKFDAGQFYINSNLENLDVLENELLNFPNVKHDDQVDAISYAVMLSEPASDFSAIGSGKKKKQTSLFL